MNSLFAPEPSKINSLCIGSGRFLRSVLVPALNSAGFRSAIFQTRGRSFLEYCLEKKETLESSTNKDSDDSGDFLTYDVDTVGFDGVVSTEYIPFYGAGTLGSQAGKDAVLNLLGQMEYISVIGVGVTEAGLASSKSQALVDLTEILYKCYSLMKNGGSEGDAAQQSLVCPNPNGRICVINTDNVPGNGNLIKKYVLEIAGRDSVMSSDEDGLTFNQFLNSRVAFHDTMVDRITSQREGSNGLVPRAEPVPAKALVIQDLEGDLPEALGSDEIKNNYGVLVRKKAGHLSGDIALKLRVANGTHTAAAHVMALCSLLTTDVLSSKSDEAELLMQYLDAIFYSQILTGAETSFGSDETKAVYEDWRKRLIHPFFGLSSFFITQNGAAKGGIRIGPTIKNLILDGKPVTVGTIFALAAILRFLTPVQRGTNLSGKGIYRGWLDGVSRSAILGSSTSNGKEEIVMYADGLSYNLTEGWYEFRCNCDIRIDGEKMTPLPELLAAFKQSQQPFAYEKIVQGYLLKNDGGDLSELAENSNTKDDFEVLIKAISTLYARMVSGDRMLNILKEISGKEGVFVDGFSTKCEVLQDGISLDQCTDDRPLHFRINPIPNDSAVLKEYIGEDEQIIRSVIFSEVSSALAIDLHTHLLPPSHGALCLWGIDELLTYHYLVAEFFMTAPPSISPEDFYAQNKRKQADMIWKALFIERSPVSEACRGVVTTLCALGLKSELNSKNLQAIREYFNSYRDDGIEGAERYSEAVYKLAGVQYAVMTNIPFDTLESQHWRPKPKVYSKRFRSALRVDPLLAGDRKAIEVALAASGYENTLEGARQYLNDWCDTIKPEYMMASTPHNFVLLEDKETLSNVKKTGVNEDAMKEPFAFVDISSSNTECNMECDGGEDAIASIIDEKSDFLSEVLMKVCEERDLPLALKIGAHRGLNPKLLQAGDGVVAFADTGVLARLCSRFPKVRFLATVLSRNNQHEACVLASKFRNLHIYGCWWFCNNPSMITEITKMRIEMLGTAFTAQHSDARVLDQLIYKWSHSRAVIADLVTKEYTKLVLSGWIPTREEIRRDIQRLFGRSYDEFMMKSFVSRTV